MTYPDPTLFGHDPWWLIVIKAVAIFAYLMLSVLVAILVERKLLGGTCVNTGCMPTKTLVASAYAAHLARRAGEFGAAHLVVCFLANFPSPRGMARWYHRLQIRNSKGCPQVFGRLRHLVEIDRRHAARHHARPVPEGAEEDRRWLSPVANAGWRC